MTGYQFLDDHLRLDQDFTPASIFTLHQKQKQHAITQEYVLKSNEDKPYEWVIGAFGFFRNMDTDSPVSFKQDGVTSLLEDNIKRNLPSTMTFDITDNELPIPSLFTEKSYSAALYHQSTYHFQSLKGLSATAGIRLDYEHVSLDYASSAMMNYNYSMVSRGMTIADALKTDVSLDGETSKGFWQIVPKLSLQYDFNTHNRVYASFYKRLSVWRLQCPDLFRPDSIRTAGCHDSANEGSIAAKFGPYVAMGMPQASVDMILSKIPVSEKIKDVSKSITYDPEYSWNYELGFHSEPVNGKLQIDGALFYIDCNNRQIAQFSPNGFGRMMKNAAGSYSKGLEISILSKPLKNIGLTASYGFTEAKFTEYKDSARVNGVYQEVDYSGKYVPMIPKHTFAMGGDYTLNVDKRCLEKVILGAQYTAASSIYWTEENALSQGFYGVSNGQISFLKDNLRFDCWIKNALNQQYNTFYFESLGKAFAQQGKPRQIGITVQYSF